MSFNALLARDAVRWVAEFGESITYTPSGGAAKAITAIVERNPMQDRPGGAFQGQGLTLWVQNDATAGVTSVKEGLDSVTLKIKDGDSSTTVLKVSRILESDAGLFHLEARK